MREDRKNNGQVKKFQYVSPVKHETLPQQWAKENILKSSTTKNKSSLSVDLENVWSIKRNFTIESPSNKNKTRQHNSFYSRYKNIPSGETSEPTITPTSSNNIGSNKVWNRSGSIQSTSRNNNNTVVDDFILQDDHHGDSFDFGNNHQRNNSQYKYSPVKEVNISKKTSPYNKPF